ncbi:hypothetical protein IIB79_04460 [candidate division KSB1 bacterium]|nr:hypothetical protein [candidate division KSB1 bacterium]
MNNYKLKVFLFLLLLWIPGSLRAQSGIGLGFGEAYSTFARGSEAIFWNPANLGFRNEGFPSFSVSLYSFRLEFGQNSIDLDLYDEFFTEKNKVLTRADVDRMLSKIPDDGFEADFRTDISLLSIAWRNIGVSFETTANANLVLPKALAEIPFTGLEQKTYDFSPHGNAEAVSKITLAYGRSIYRNISVFLPLIGRLDFSEITLGGSLSYHLGLGTFQTENATLFATFSDDGVVANGSFRGKATHLFRQEQPDGDFDTEFIEDFEPGGAGYGFSLAASGKLDNGYIISVVFKNLLNSVKWDKSAFQLDRSFDTGDPKFFIGPGQLEELNEDDISEDNDREIDSFTTSAPVELRVGIGKKSGRLRYAGEIGREDDQFLAALGAGLRWFIFDLSAGYKYKFAHNVSFGVGIGNDHLYWDAGFGSRGGVTPGSNKGIVVASTLRFGF